MQYQEISLEKLINYLEGSATEPTRKQIDHELQNNPDFVEEFEDWEAFLNDAESREEGISKMKNFSTAWTESNIDTSVIEPQAKIIDFEPARKVEGKNATSRPLFFKMAIAACVLLIAGVIISNLMQGPDIANHIDHSFAQEMSILLSPNAGRGGVESQKGIEGLEKYDVFLAKLIRKEKFQQANNSLDSLISMYPHETKYQYLQGMNLSLFGQNEPAIVQLKSLINREGNAAAFNCKLRMNLAMLYAKTGKEQLFQQSLTDLKSQKEQGFVCTELDASILTKLEELPTNF